MSLNGIPDYLLEYLQELPASVLLLIFLIENLLITAATLTVGNFIIKHGRRDKINTDGNSRKDWEICIVTNLLNTFVTYTGFWLWKHGVITIRESLFENTLIDFIVLFLAMDFLMYVFHYLIHKTFLYNLIHTLHHQAIQPKPIDLFVLHPLEVLAFGGLWLAVLVVYTSSISAIVIYLVVNIVFGLVGHLGFEPLPQTRFFRYIGTSSFHHDHHKDLHVNFGFYTTIWDRLFRTIKPH